MCLEFDVRTLDFASALQVTYDPDYPEFSLASGTDIAPFLSKSSDWAYEQEYRLIAQERTGGNCVRHVDDVRDDGLFDFSKRALVSVIIGAEGNTSNLGRDRRAWSSIGCIHQKSGQRACLIVTR